MTGFVSKRQAAQAKLDDDDAQGYVAEYEEALLISYQSGFADGKRAAQRKPPPEWEAINNIIAEYGLQAIDFVADWKAAQRPWQGLTEWEREAIAHACGAMGSEWLVFIEAVEKALMEKNR